MIFNALGRGGDSLRAIGGQTERRSVDAASAGAAFAAALKDALRKGVGHGDGRWTQDAFAVAVGVSVDSVANWANGRSLPNEVSFELAMRVLSDGAKEAWEVESLAALRQHWQDAQRRNPPPAATAISRGRGTALAIALVVAAAGMAGLVWLMGRSAPADETARYLERFENSATAVGAARSQISERLWQVSPTIETLNRILEANPQDPDALAARAALIARLIRGDASRPSLAPDLHEVIVFFEQVASCIAVEACDPDRVGSALGAYAEVFWLNWSGFVADRRATQPDYGAGLESIALAARAERS